MNKPIENEQNNQNNLSQYRELKDLSVVQLGYKLIKNEVINPLMTKK